MTKSSGSYFFVDVSFFCVVVSDLFRWCVCECVVQVQFLVAYAESKEHVNINQCLVVFSFFLKKEPCDDCVFPSEKYFPSPALSFFLFLSFFPLFAVFPLLFSLAI